MRLQLTTVILLLSLSGFAQKHFPGLFGKCDEHFGGYMCQQVLFRADSTFEFYDLLHLRGWTVSNGVWKMNGDTILLNSLNQRFIINYFGESDNPNITLKFFTDSFPIAFAPVRQDKMEYKFDSTGVLILPRQTLDSITFTYYGTIIFDRTKLRSAKSIEIIFNGLFFDKYDFNNEKWLLKRNKIYHSKKSDGTFDTKRYFIKAKMSDLKYHAK